MAQALAASSSFAGAALRRPVAAPKARGTCRRRAAAVVAPRAALEGQRMATPFDGFK